LGQFKGFKSLVARKGKGRKKKKFFHVSAVPENRTILKKVFSTRGSFKSKCPSYEIKTQSK